MLHQSIFEPGSATAISLPEVVGAFSYTLDVGAGRAAGHSVRTCWIGMNVGRQYCVPDEDLRDLYYVLLLANSGFGQLHVSADVARGIAHVREHWDGSGKPSQLRGQAIPLASRITLLAQLVDLTHAKFRRAGAMREVRRLSGTWLQPDLVDVFERVAARDFLWTQLTGPFLDARVAMMAPQESIDPGAADLLGDITIDLARILRSKNVDGDCVAAFRRAGITGG
ncbi:MAG TPA: HD domain-containing phosphohydrolase [Sphingomicrobium sp.]|nr:HD domain-containing phosphohydrolase [Sphingomicrobium sp.]